MILAERAARMEAQAAAAYATAVNSSADALIVRLKLEIEKLRRDLYGSRSERKARLLEQMELQLEDLEANATEDELLAEQVSRTTVVKAFERKRPSRKPFPEYLPRERVVIEAPESCPCCGSAKLSKLGEDITETLEGDCRIFCARGRFSSLADEPFAEDDGELCFGLDPVPWRAFPVLGSVVQHQV